MSDFAVRAEETRNRPGEFRVSMTMNGYQWMSLPVTIMDEARAERVAAFLRDELAPEAARMDAEIEAFMQERL
jgi:hypothetical protein